MGCCMGKWFLDLELLFYVFFSDVFFMFVFWNLFLTLALYIVLALKNTYI